MKNSVPAASEIAEFREIGEQAKVELSILLGLDETLRLALEWMTRDCATNRKLSTLRFQTWSFERQLARVHVLADHGGYLHRITEGNPHLVREVSTLGSERAGLHGDLERIIVRLDGASPDDAALLVEICADLSRFLDQLRTHGQKEGDLLQRSFIQEQGGSG